MPDTPPLTPRDYDPWQLATPQQLLTLLERLGISGSEVARWLHVPRSAISMWRHGSRAIPQKHIPALRERTRHAFDQAAELNTKTVALAPTEDLRQALRAEFAALWTRWKAEVLHEAGTLRRGLQTDVDTLTALLAHQPFAAEDPETIDLVMDTIRQKVALLVELEGLADPEQALLDRLTQAHESIQPTTSEKSDDEKRTEP
jgi:predicted transcriptional regulator